VPFAQSLKSDVCESWSDKIKWKVIWTTRSAGSVRCGMVASCAGVSSKMRVKVELRASETDALDFEVTSG
jgi:hypothetical protein